ncbi:glycosyltransferase, partial [Patescibacteria group bacterium]|nr:glycosyltransferase [Patescibacteria group bacterium]
MSSSPAQGNTNNSKTRSSQTRLASSTRQILDKVLHNKLPKAEAARRLGVSRKTVYVWLKRYKKEKEDPTSPIQVRPGLRGARPTKLEERRGASKRESFKRDILRIITANPNFGPQKISKELKKRQKYLSPRSVWLLLKDLDLQTAEKRADYASKYRQPSQAKDPKFPIHLRLTPEARKRMVEEVILSGRKVNNVCGEFQVPRKTYAKWKKRYIQAQKAGDNLLLALTDQHPEGQDHPRGASNQSIKVVLGTVVESPSLSSHKIAEKLGFIGNHGVQNILKRNNLNLYQMRQAYSRTHKVAPAPKPAPIPVGFLDRIRLVWEQFMPSLAPAPPPSPREPLAKWGKVFFTSAFLTFLISSGLISWVRLLGAVSATQVIGLIFASTALFMGSLFFLYSLKYYITLAIVLSFSQRDVGERNGRGSSTSSGSKGFLSWILGMANGSAEQNSSSLKNGRSGPVGLEPNLEHIVLKRYPVVSVHIPLYNEKNVAERAMAAATSFDYQGKYEVIIADDSTDETKDIIRKYQEKHLAKGEKLKVIKNKKQGWELTQVEVRPGVTLKHLHRTSRSGFKGGALSLALTLTDPKAEFISVFDADFVPYPDTLELFLKYFKIQNNMSEDYKKSNVAAVQGYQWHVLNKSENWITRGVRSEYAGSYIIERPGEEIYGGLKQISGAVYMIRRDVLEEVGWETSITEDFQLTLKLYEKGYKVVYTPYIQAPAECVSTLKRLIRQRMRWAEGHSNNIRKMFVRLMVGRWENIPDSGSNVGKFLSSNYSKQVPNPKSQLGQLEIRSIRNSRDGQRVFVKSPLTLSEKLEFLYLSPYYLQAFFFLVGTISWLISETIFQAGLPFWTVLWGWSLVLTNMLSLPLMNAVGLFLEESEEKDYVGLASFVALSYILVPFQAYASLKGFLQKEEGPWFRTPKTGHITDVIARGRFYRFITGILPRRSQPAVAQRLASSGQRLGLLSLNAQPSTLNAYLSLSSANSRFNTFNIRSRKGQRWIGKLMVTVLLLISTTLVTFAPYIPVDTNPDIPAPGAGSILTPDGKQSYFPNLNLVREAHASTNSKTEMDTSFTLKTKGLKLSGDVKDFSIREHPSFSLKFKRNIFTKIYSWLNTPIGKELELPEFSVTVIDSNGKKVEGVEIKKNGGDTAELVFEPKPGLKSGKYSLIVKDGNGNGLLQDFTWGVLAINTNKSIFLPGETAKLQMAVVDNEGLPVCDARLELQIKSPRGSISQLSTSQGEIVTSEECNDHDYTLVPDYSTSYSIPSEKGDYQLILNAKTQDGEYTITDQFQVKKEKDIPFDVEREEATRLYPKATYPVKLSITANDDFQGTVTETVPITFSIFNPEDPVVAPYSTVVKHEEYTGAFKQKTDSGWEEVSLAEDEKKETLVNTKTITWYVDMKKGETHTLGYRYKIPVYAPAFYIKGPLAIGTRVQGLGFREEFREARQWQLAADAVDITFTELQDTWTDAPTGWNTRDLATFGVPANAIVEVAAGHNETAGTETMGVREVGSGLERSFVLGEAESGGEEYVVMHVNTDASSDIQTRNTDTVEDFFMLLGYWSGGTYVEAMTALAEPSGAATWEDLNLSGNGLNASDVAEIVLTNAEAAVDNQVGVRENVTSGAVARLVDLHEAENGGVTTATMLVQADGTTNATIEIYEEDLTNNDLTLVGYWSDPPGRYEDEYETIAAPTTDGTWQTRTLSTVTASSVTEILLLGGHLSRENHFGVRPVGDSGNAARLLDVQEAEAGGRAAGRMHTTVDSSKQLDIYHEDVSETPFEFQLIGYWDLFTLTISGNVYISGSEVTNDSTLYTIAASV